MTTYATNAELGDTLEKHCIHMEQNVWEQATRTARSLGLSTSQFLSRLVDETSGEIGRGGLLGMVRESSALQQD